MSNLIFIKYHLNSFGGLEKYFSRIIDAFLKKGYKITILTTNSSEKKTSKNLKIVIFKSFKTFKFLKLKIFDFRCYSWIKRNKAKTVFSFDRISYFTHTRLGNGLHLSYLKRRELFEKPFKSFINKINPLHRAILKIEKKGFEQKNLKKVIVNSTMIQEELLKEYNFDPKKIKVILNGVEYNELENDFINWHHKKPLIVKKLNLDLRDFHFVFIGNDYNRKGLKFLLKALSNLKDKKFHLSVIGKDKNIKKYISFAKKNKLDKKVSFFGPRKDIINFLKLADCFTLPTLYDPFANALIEALAMGVFVITSKYNGAKQIITNKNGVVIDPIDTLSFTKALLTCMQTKKNFENSKKIRQTVKDLDFSNQLETLINEVIS
ncbi:MAG: Lipopolysaccharide core biosynthesis protein RfaG [Candidatus Anoxychlamydiales bacterium]|nr:Lipopolysaccharide core biosynthesis protein RfaG [Candidatus Anoxychlamydiales bacterium]